MGTKDPRIDAYIANSADFAKPILGHIRKLVHDTCPDVEETLKWRSPHFMYKGMLCGMASFKNHCAFGFWKGTMIPGKDGQKTEEAIGQFGKITDVSDLPKDEILVHYIREAIRLNDAGVKLPAKSKSKERRELNVPDYFTAALRKNKKAWTTFESFSPSTTTLSILLLSYSSLIGKGAATKRAGAEHANQDLLQAATHFRQSQRKSFFCRVAVPAARTHKPDKPE